MKRRVKNDKIMTQVFKFAAYSQNTFLQEHLCRAASERIGETKTCLRF